MPDNRRQSRHDCREHLFQPLMIIRLVGFSDSPRGCSSCPFQDAPISLNTEKVIEKEIRRLLLISIHHLWLITRDLGL